MIIVIRIYYNHPLNSLGIIPNTWRDSYVTSNSINLGDWFTDFILRCKTLTTRYTNVCSSRSSSNSSSSSDDRAWYEIVYWIGGMFTPEAFLTASRQQIAQVS